MEWEYHQDGITIPSRWFDNTILMELTESGRQSKSRGRGAHYVPRVKDSSKREVAFSLVLVYRVGAQVCVYQVDTDHHRPVRRAEMIKPPRTNAAVLVVRRT